MKKKQIYFSFFIFLLINIHNCYQSSLLPKTNSELENFMAKDNIVTDDIILNPDITYKAGFIKSTQTYYRINLEDITNINILNIYFTVLSGNADMFIYSDAEHKMLIEKKNFRHVYKKEIIEITEDFLENYYISIVLHESSYFEIKYDININEKEYILLNNEVNIEYLNKEQNFKKYTIKTDSENNYLLIKTQDCSFTFENVESQDKNFTYKYYEFQEKEFTFNLKVEEYFHTFQNNNEDCTIFITTGTKSDSKNPLLIHENVPSPSFSFIKTYYNFSFVYDEFFNGVMVNLELELDPNMDATISPQLKINFVIGEQEAQKYIYKSKLLFIKSDIENYCKKDNVCNLQMTIENMDSSSENNYYLIYTTIQLESELSPIYIDKNRVYNEKMLSLSSKYFYTPIDENEEGEINIMFNKGSGKIFAKIVKNNFLERDANWNRRVQLPEENSENLLKFDSIKGSLKYDTNNYDNCVNGCELYILVKGNETTNARQIFNEFSFSIDKRRKDIEQNGVINLLLNNYIKGNMTKNIYKYYTFTLNFDIKKISINFYSYYGRLFVKLGKGHIVNEDNYDWKLERNNNRNYRLIISCEDEKIGKDSLKNVHFSIGIIPSDTIDENNMNTYYFLQVQTLHNDNVNYYYLESERSIICKTEDYEYCNIVIPLLNENNDGNIVVYASSITNEESNINILSKYYYDYQINNISFNESIAQKFPTEEDHDHSSNGKKYLLLDDRTHLILSDYIFLTIDTKEKNNTIRIILSPSSNIIKTSLPPFTERLIFINEKETVNFTILDNNHPSNDYILNIKTLSGISELVLGENDYYSEIYGNYINEISPDYTTPMQINNVNNYLNMSNILIISFTQKDNQIRGYNLIKNINNEISFSLTENPFRQYGYFEMKNKNIKLNIYLHDIEYKGYRKSLNLFNIDAMIVPDDGNTFNVNGNYLIYENIGYMDFRYYTGKYINESYDIYAFIERAYGNDNVYKKIKEQITVSEIYENNEIKITPGAKYFYSLNDNEDIISLVLTKNTNQNIFWLIDIAENIPVLNKFKYIFEVGDRNISDYQSYDYMGKKRIIIDDSKYYINENYIKLFIFKNDINDSIPANLTIQYYTLPEISSIQEYKDFDNYIYIQNSEERSNFTFKNLLYYYNDSLSSVTYYIDIYNKTEECANYNNIYTVFLGNRDDENIVFHRTIDWLKSDYENYTQYIPKELENDTLLIRVVASFINNKGFEERIVYKVDNEDENPDSESEYMFSLVVYICVFIALTIIAIIVILILVNIEKKALKRPNKMKNGKVELLSNLDETKNE